MKNYFKIALAGLFMITILGSCGTGRFIDNDKQCGFENEIGGQETDINTPVKAKTSPAADRGNTISENVSIESNPDLSSSDDQDVQKVSNKRKSRKETRIGNTKRKRFKDIVKAVKEQKQNNNRGMDGMTILLIILAIILPPLAVGIFEGITGRFWLVLILWLLGIGLLAWLLPGLFYLGAIIAIIVALLIVLGVW